MKKNLFLLIFVVISFFIVSCGEDKKDDGVYNEEDLETTEIVSNPQFSQQAGIYLEELSIEISTKTEDASIYYTTDGTDPDDKSTLYSDPIVIPLETTMLIKAIAYKEKFNPSAIVSANYSVTGVLNLPEFNVSPGVYPEPQSVSLSHDDSEAVIKYTTNGTDPTSRSKTYSVPFSLVSESTTEIRAKAFRDNWGESATAEGLFVITGTVLSPEFATEPGIYTEAKNVTITCENPEAEIRYEVYDEDGGADPIVTSTLYTQPFLIPIDTTAVVKAAAFLEGWNPSPAITGEFIVTGTVDQPVFSPTEGTYTSEQNVTIGVSTEGAVVRYTLDGTEPTDLSPLHSSTPIAIPLNTQLLIKAKGFKKDWTSSDTVGGNYKITGKVADPIFSIIPDYYTSAKNVAITTTTEDASIKFTIDGTEPTKTHGNEYTGAISIASTTTLKTIAYKTDWLDSNTSEGTYNITGQVTAPVFTPTQGNYTDAQTVSLESNIPGVTIRYTIDESNPSRTTGLIYSDPFTLSQTTTIKAFAYRNDWETTSDSAVSTAIYTITGRVSNPTFSIEPGNYTLTKTVTLSSETTESVIRYTLDGSDPSRTEGTLYSAGIVVDESLTIKAIAYKLDWEESSNSEIATGIYNITGKVYSPEITPTETNHTSSVLVTLSSITSGATIKYTTNGDNPTRIVGTLYTDPFSVSTGNTVKAIAFKDEWEETSNSDISSIEYVITGKVINPKFDITPGNYTTTKTVKITTETLGAVIRYTTDGSTPTRETGTPYSATGIPVSETKTLKAIAYKTDWQESSNSDVLSGLYTITGTVYAPTITPTDENHTESVEVVLASITEGAVIRYTTDGTTNPTRIAGTLYANPFTVSSTTTVKAIAYKPDWEETSNSTVTSKSYTMTGKVEKPKLSFEPGNYTNAVSLTLSCDTTGAKIRYTDDGSTPSRTAGALYTGTISIPSTRTIKVIAYKDDWENSSNSDVVSAVYTITGKVITPVMTPFTGNYTENTSVTIVTSTEDAVIRYTTNGSVPSRTNGLIYTGSIIVNSTTTVKAFAYMTNWQTTSDSDVVSGIFTITGTVANPLFSVEPGNYTAPKDVTLSTPTSGATIKYTLNGDDPSRDVGTIYTTKLTISSSTTVKAIAYKSDWQNSSDSNVVLALYNITGKTAAPTITPVSQNHTDNVEISIISLTEGAVIRYTTDGTSPTRSIGNIYGVPFTLSSSATVKAVAYKTDWEETSNSDVASKSYTITGKVVNPKFDITPGNYTTTKTVKITTETTGATIRYTLDGTTPTRTNGTVYDTTGISVSETKTLKAIAYKTDWEESSNSDILSGLYTITGTVYAPTATPTDENHTASVEVTLASITEGAVIRYTTDGTTNPTRVVGTLYANPFTVSATTTVKAIAYKPDWEETSNSTVTSKSYTITGKVETPKLSLEEGNYTDTVSLTLSCDTPGAAIRYTVDESDPSRTYGTQYTGTISIPSTRTVKIIAYKDDWEDSSNSDIASGLFTITGKTATPVMTPIARTYTITTAVTITTDTEGATIKYTTNGVVPTRSTGTIYTVPVQIESTATLKAIAYTENWQSTSDSDVASGLYTITGKVANPIITPQTEFYTSTQSVTITCATSGANIQYTTDGSEPSEINGFPYNGAFNVSATATIKAFAYKDEWQISSDSDVISETLTITGKVVAPTATPTDENHTASFEVTLASITEGAVIRYTTDGTTNPTRVVGTLYANPFTVSATTTVKAIAYKPDWEETSNSTVTSKVYTITGKVETPKLSLEEGNYTNTVSLTLSCDTPGAAIRYTIDESNPSKATGILYTGAISIPSTRTVKIIAYKDDWEDSSNSDIASGLFTITGKTATPVMTPSAGNYTITTPVTITTDTIGAEIRYTTNGVVPTRSTGTIYTVPVQIESTATLKAIAYTEDWQSTSDSNVASGLYTITGKVANPIITPQTEFYTSTQSVTITCATSGANIQYTTDGSEPSEINGSLYSGAFNVSATATVKAFAYKDEWQISSDSDVISETLTITGTVVAPTATPTDENHTASVEVTLASITEGAVIRYTTDGTTNPTRVVGTLYVNPFTVSATTTVKAIAYKPDWEETSNSTVTSKVYTITGKVETPKLSLEEGNYTDTVSLTLSCDTPGAAMRYTIDESDPSKTAGILYTGAISIPSTRTITVIAYKDGWENSSNSDIASGLFTITGKTATPVMTPNAGNYTITTAVTITTDTTGATIKYTTNGVVPTRSTGTIYTVPVQIESTATLNAIAYKEDWQSTSDSDVASGLYTITGKVANPEITPQTGFYMSTQSVTITCATSGANIQYTTDGSEPSIINGSSYNGAFDVSATAIVKTFAYKDEWQVSSDSDVISETLTITGTVVAPAFNPAGGKYTDSQYITITSQTQEISGDVVIRYSLDGSVPTRSSTEYTGPVLIAETKDLKAIAYVPQWESTSDSSVSTASYEITGIVPTPEITPNGGEEEDEISVTISAIGGATIKYTTDGSVPSRTAGSTYSSEIELTSSSTVKAMAYVSDWETTSDSLIASAVFRVYGNVTAPTFSPEPLAIPTTESVYISMSSITPEWTIRYTLDGTDPSTTTGTIFTETSTPITISQPTTIRAIAYKEGMEVDWTPSSISSALYKMKVKTPVFSPEGDTYNANKSITINSATPDVTIYYITTTPTLDVNGFPGDCLEGCPAGFLCNDDYNRCEDDTQSPNEASTQYSGPVTIAGSSTLKAIAYKDGGGEGWVASDIKTDFYNMKAGRPTFTVPDGRYTKAQDLEISTPTGVIYEIRYNIKESSVHCDPVDWGTYTPVNPGDIRKYPDHPMSVETTTDFIAIVCKQGWDNSAIGESHLEIKASTPLIDPPTDTYGFSQTVTITSETPGAHNILYTTDGSEPVINLPPDLPTKLYSVPFAVTEPSIIKAIAIKTDCIDSDVATEVLFDELTEPIEVNVLHPASIQAAINSAVASSIIKISCGSSTPPCTFNETLTMKDGVSLLGIEDVTIEGSASNGTGIIFPSSVKSLTFIDNITVMGGGDTIETKGIYIASGASPTIRNCIIEGGIGSDTTYGIFNNGISPQIYNNEIYGGDGSDSYAVYNANSTRPLIKENIIYGGDNDNSYGIFNMNSETLIISNEIDSGNSTTAYSIFNDNSNNVKIFGNHIKGCSDENLCSDSYGINISNNATVYIVNNLIDGGKASASSYGIYNESKDLIVSNNTISGGSAPESASYTIYNEKSATSSDSLDIQIKNNILYTENSSAETFCLYEKNSKSYFTIVKNNDFFNCETMLYKDGTISIIDIGSVNDYDGMSNNIDSDPDFTGLKPGEPSLQSGLNLYNDFYFPTNTDGEPIDYDGSIRSSNFPSVPWWVGAYEM